MIQPDLFDPPRVKPTVADLLGRTWKPAPWPKGYACIYKATLVGTTRAYVGKTVDLRARFKVHMRDDQVIDRALKKHGPENFSVEVLRVFETEREAYDQEDWFIEAHRTRNADGGYNIGEGGGGFTKEEARRASPLGAALGGEVNARNAGYPRRRVLAELEKGPRTKASMVASLGLTEMQVRDAVYGLRRNGRHIIFEGEGLFHLVTLEEAADHWACGPALRDIDRVFGALMAGPRTIAELMAAFGRRCNSIRGNIDSLRKNGYNIETRGATRRLGSRGTYHLIQDKRHPWLHVGVMDLRGAAWDDPTFSLQYRKD